MKILTLLTDFGTKSGYVAQMKGVLSAIAPDARVIDITHEITPHNIREGAFVLLTTIPYYPIGTVHIAVVDPGVGTERKGIIITAKNHVMIGPDNGLLIPIARFLGDFTVYEITNKKYMLEEISNTFHGRDIFTPVAGHILKGIAFEKIGRNTNNYIDLDFGQGKISNTTATGKIIYIDRFGNIITNIMGYNLKDFLNYDKKIRVYIKDKKHEIMYVKAYNYVKKGQLLTTLGSSNYLEIGINQGNAARRLGVKPDEKIRIEFN
jgi:S-adenosylmethionine hydrolase